MRILPRVLLGLASRLGYILGVALACGFAGLANAAIYDGTINLTAPTTRVGGAALTAAEIAGYRVYFNCDATPSQQNGQKTGPSPLVMPGLFPADGTYKVCIAAVDTGGRVSALSNTFTASPSTIGPPSAPTINSISVTCPDGTPATAIQVTPTEFRFECSAP